MQQIKAWQQLNRLIPIPKVHLGVQHSRGDLRDLGHEAELGRRAVLLRGALLGAESGDVSHLLRETSRGRLQRAISNN